MARSRCVYRARARGIAANARLRDGYFSVPSRTRAIAVVRASRGRDRPRIHTAHLSVSGREYLSDLCPERALVLTVVMCFCDL